MLNIVYKVCLCLMLLLVFVFFSRVHCDDYFLFCTCFSIPGHTFLLILMFLKIRSSVQNKDKKEYNEDHQLYKINNTNWNNNIFAKDYGILPVENLFIALNVGCWE